MSQQQPSLGRIVHFTISPEELRPAVVTKVHSATCVDLCVFGGGEGAHDGKGLSWPTSVVEGPASSPRSWSWPQRV